MTLILRPATIADAEALTNIYFSAFSSDEISLLCFPRSPVSWTWWYNSILSEVQDPSSHFLCIQDSSSPTPEIISYAKWNDKFAPVATINDLPEWPQGCDVKVANHFFGTLIERRRGIMGERKHWYLEIIATKPESQSKGAAGKLMRWGLERADEDGVETYLEASPVGKEVYEHFGFEEKARLVVSVDGKSDFVECMMVRPRKEKVDGV
ncbi:putative gnat family protein [Botrytis fragariae]|uniref:Putative gnat family protein n=1 Tax=Botrytis fragariae TaxID=1964551 RepID=A0A8H6B4A0_9HELO|nr:putative gnat family protein [Botrytis fragariae]KAF5879156.1 putative gnat family protein [Botrytis fragariae]